MASILSSFFSNNGVDNLDSAKFETQMNSDNNSILLDTRTPGEYSQGRIPKSILIDFMQPGFKNEIDQLDKSKSYYVYCRSGNRSYHACRLMKNMGFENVYNLKSGIIGWHGEIIQ